MRVNPSRPFTHTTTSREKKQVGHAAKPLGIRELVTGGPVYAADVQMPDMLYGRAIAPPVRNAHIASLDTSGVTAISGLVELVVEDDFVGVVCKTPSAVDAAMAQINVTWNLEQPINQEEIDRLVNVDAEMAKGDLEHALLDQAHRTKMPNGRSICVSTCRCRPTPNRNLVLPSRASTTQMRTINLKYGREHKTPGQ